MDTIAITAPVYNESQIILTFLKELNQVLFPLISKYKFEIILVNDGSTDTTSDVIKSYCDKIDLRVITLARNFGHQVACQVCLEKSFEQNYDAIVLMDSDLQDDPTAICEFIKKWEQGYSVCYAVRSSRKENLIYRFLFNSFYKILNMCSSFSIPQNSGNFSLMNKKVVENIIKSNPKHWYLPGIRAHVGFLQIGVMVPRRARPDKKSKVGILGLFRLSLNAIFSFSYFPLRIFNFLGCIAFFIAFLLLLFIAHTYFFTDLTIPAWSSIMTTIIFFGGINLFGIGIIGEYIAIIHSRQQNLINYTVFEEYVIKNESVRK